MRIAKGKNFETGPRSVKPTFGARWVGFVMRHRVPALLVTVLGGAERSPKSGAFFEYPEAAAVALAEGARRLVDHAARWSPRKRGYSFWKVRGTSPRPPLRCLAMMSSASPGASVVSGL